MFQDHLCEHRHESSGNLGQLRVQESVKEVEENLPVY